MYSMEEYRNVLQHISSEIGEELELPNVGVGKPDEHDIGKLMKYYDGMADKLNSLDEARRTLAQSDSVRAYQQQMSGTSAEDIRRQMQIANSMSEKLHRDLDEQIDHTISELFEKTDPSDNAEYYYEQVVYRLDEHSRFIYLLAKSLVRYLKPYYRNKLMEHVQRSAVGILGARIIPDTARHRNVIQALMSRHRLVPVSDVMSWREISGHISNNYILIVKGGQNTAIHYNIMPYISNGYLRDHDMETQPGSGLNYQHINRYANTMKILGERADRCADRVDMSNFNPQSDYTYVVETHNCQDYRLMGWQLGSYHVPTRKLSNSMLEDGKPALNTKPELYNYHQEQEIFSNPDEIAGVYAGYTGQQFSAEEVRGLVHKLWNKHDVDKILFRALDEKVSEQVGASSMLSTVSQLTFMSGNLQKEYMRNKRAGIDHFSDLMAVSPTSKNFEDYYFENVFWSI